MKRRSVLRFLWESIEGLVVLPAVVLTWPLSKRWFDNWGADEGERTGKWLGDDLVLSINHIHTRAISIAAPPETVWSWLVQFGFGKAGFYSYELLERLAGIPVTNLEEVHSSLQTLDVGDEVLLHPTAPGIPVAYLQRGHHLCFGKQTPATASESDLARSWSFYLRPIGNESCRLLSRSCLARPRRFAKRSALALVEPIDFVMEQRMLRTVKRLAETKA